MNTTIVVLTVVVFALVGTLVFAGIAPYLSSEVDGARPTTLPPCDDKNTHNDNVCRARPPPGPR
jgi:hypothetical protein